jgi:hypothetical protein
MVMEVFERGVTKVLICRNPGVTVRAAGVLLIPPAEAVICALPGSIPVARPLPELIVAMLEALLDQLNATPLIALPPESLAIAVNCCVPLTAIDADGELIVTLATTGEVPPP